MKILMVCLGNICRSPLAEVILRNKAEERGIEIEVDSAGTGDYHIGENPDKRSQKNAKENGLDISSLCARQFTVADYDAFDKIYVMDQSNYENVINIARNDLDKTKVEMILNNTFPGSNKPVPDPYFGGEEGFQEVHDLLVEACDVILDKIEDEQ